MVRYKRVRFPSPLVRSVPRVTERPSQLSPLQGQFQGRREGSHLRPVAPVNNEVVLPSTAAIAREELLFASLGLVLKAAGLVLAVVSLAKLAIAHQERLDRHSEIQAVLQLQSDRLQKREHELDRLFSADGQQVVFQQEQQWIAPNRRRIVWAPAAKSPTP